MFYLSEDKDIIVFLFFIDTNHSNTRKKVDISCPILSEVEYHSLLGMYAFSGKDYISQFFWQGKKQLENVNEIPRIYIKKLNLGQHKVFQ